MVSTQPLLQVPQWHLAIHHVLPKDNKFINILKRKKNYNPTCPPWNSIEWVPCVPAYTLSSPVFKGVTLGMSFKHNPLPLLPQVLVGEARCLEHTNNLGNLQTSILIWRPQGCHKIKLCWKYLISCNLYGGCNKLNSSATHKYFVISSKFIRI